MNNNIIRQVVLDTETTGMNKHKLHYEDHRIIEIAAVEIINRRLTSRYFHVYLNPNRHIDSEAFNIHGINENFLKDKPKFSEISSVFLNFLSDSELIVHNASFDIGFIDYEFSMLKNDVKKLSSLHNIIDTLQLARKLFPGKRNSLDALCERYHINNSIRYKHSALIDARLLAEVFLLMTGGQIPMFFTENVVKSSMMLPIVTKKIFSVCESKDVPRYSMKIIYANEDEIELHEEYLNILEKNSNNSCCVWRKKRIFSK